MVIHAPDLSSQLLRQRQAYDRMLEAIRWGDLAITPWLHWFLEQVRAAALTNAVVVEAVKAKALFWWTHRTTESGLSAGVETGDGGRLTPREPSLRMT